MISKLNKLKNMQHSQQIGKVQSKIVLITGASSGIGEACAIQFASQGATLILTARRIDRLKALQADIQRQFETKVLTLKLDVQDKTQVKEMIHGLPKEWRCIDILVNNAGLALSSDKIQDGDNENWDIMIHTNISGLLYVTHAILPGMISRNCGHIVNIGSVAGHECYPNGNVYSATKHAVKAISKSLRLDLLGKAIRVTEIDPGAVHTEFSEVRWKDKERAEKFYSEFIPLAAEDIADAVLYAVTRPAHVDIAEMVIYSIDQASPNHFNRKID